MNPDDPIYDDDDDVLEPDAASDAAERARARSFAELVDKMMAGRTPAAVPSEAQPLLEVATAIRATVQPAALAASRQRAIIEAALATAIDRRAGNPAGNGPSQPAERLDALAARRRSPRTPWLVATVTSVVAAAAIAMLVMQPGPAPVRPSPAPVAKLPFDQRSRPADALVGAIARERAGDAVGRIDAIYADRLGGFRDRTLYGGAP